MFYHQFETVDSIHKAIDNMVYLEKYLNKKEESGEEVSDEEEEDEEYMGLGADHAIWLDDGVAAATPHPIWLDDGLLLAPTACPTISQIVKQKEKLIVQLEKEKAEGDYTACEIIKGNIKEYTELIESKKAEENKKLVLKNALEK